ncbi:MAG: ABC transporter permease, partial [Pseudoxanthomonas sp.]
MSGVWLAEAAQSWRGLLRRPGYLLLAALTLALGVATATTVFALIDQALLRPLPFPQAERLVTLGMQTDDIDGLLDANVGSPGYYVAARRMRGLVSAGMSLDFTRNSNIALGDVAEVVPSLSADRGFLRTLGVQPLLGRNFSEEEDRPNGPQAAILGYDLWRQRFGGDPAIVGKTLLVEGKAVPIVGVLPREFVWPDRFDLLLPLQPDPVSTSADTNQYIVARLRAGTTLAAVTAETEALMRPVAAAQLDRLNLRDTLARMRFTALPLRESIFASRSGRVLWMFLATALCVLAIATFNLSNLMLLRSLLRDHDTAVRAALGAAAARLALPAFAEAALVGLAGAGGGLLLAWLGLRLLAGWVPPEWLRGQAPTLSAGALALAMLVGVAVALAGAALGGWRGRRRAALAVLGREGQSGLGRGANRLVHALVVVQVAAAVLLLLGAALFGRSLQRLSQVPMGFESRSIVTFTLSPIRATVADIAAASGQTRAVLSALEREFGAGLAGASTNLPTASQLNIGVEFPDARSSTSVQYRPVTSRFLDVFGIPLLAGRSFDAKLDRAGAEAVAVVSQSFARKYLHGDALGKVLRRSGNRDMPMRVVGVVGDVRQFGPAEDAPPVLYVALEQVDPELWRTLRDYLPLQYAVQVRPGVEGELMQRLPELVRQVSPGQPIADVQTMQAVVAST